MTKTEPSGHRYWLKEHQITAFWHDFGISNGLFVPLEHVQKHRYARGTPREVMVVSAEFMRDKLESFNKSLASYGESWNSGMPHPYGINTREQFMADDKTHENRAPILTMIENLQEFRIEDKE
jgi:hypothetical protein